MIEREIAEEREENRAVRQCDARRATIALQVKNPRPPEIKAKKNVLFKAGQQFDSVTARGHTIRGKDGDPCKCQQCGAQISESYFSRGWHCDACASSAKEKAVSE